MKSFQVGSATFGDGRLTIIAGPCVIESPEHAMTMARECADRARAAGLDFVFKSSFDKANRSSIKSFRGVGVDAGLEILRHIKSELGVPVVTDVHDVAQVAAVAEVADILQIPAFLCRQTDLLAEAAASGKIVNVKKGQFLSPWDAENIVKKLEEAGTQKILLTDRGTSFGYNNLVSDFRSIPVMRSFGYPVVYDVTHSVQLPGGKGSVSSGMAEFIPTLSRCGISAGADAIFMEIHENPAEALSDGPNAMALDKLRGNLEILCELKKVISKVELALK